MVVYIEWFTDYGAANALALLSIDDQGSELPSEPYVHLSMHTALHLSVLCDMVTVPKDIIVSFWNNSITTISISSEDIYYM